MAYSLTVPHPCPPAQVYAYEDHRYHETVIRCLACGKVVALPLALVLGPRERVYGVLASELGVACAERAMGLLKR
jgi:hypothetical protein